VGERQRLEKTRTACPACPASLMEFLSGSQCTEIPARKENFFFVTSIFRRNVSRLRVLERCSPTSPTTRTSCAPPLFASLSSLAALAGDLASVRVLLGAKRNFYFFFLSSGKLSTFSAENKLEVLFTRHHVRREKKQQAKEEKCFCSLSPPPPPHSSLPAFRIA
jgi:hypothetical protein